VTQRIIGSNYKNNISEKLNPEMSDSFFKGQATWWTRHQSLLNNAGCPIDKNGRIVDPEGQKKEVIKRKAWDSDSDGGLDLNLSLKAPNKLDEFEKGSDNGGDGVNVVSSLSLSLSSSPTSKLGRFKEEDGHMKRSRTTTRTLDLTL
jgi:hypothetical protein